MSAPASRLPWAAGLLLIVLVGASLAMAFLRRPPSTGGASKDEGPAAQGEMPASPVEAAAVQASLPAADVLPESLPELAEWNTFHGGPSLDGYSPEPLGLPLYFAWEYLTGSSIEHSPVVAGGRVFVVTSHGRAAALDLRGRELWTRALHAGTRYDGSPRAALFDAPPAVFGGLLYLADADGMLFALDAASGEERWVKDLGAPILGSVNLGHTAAGESAVSQRALYVIAQDEGALHALDPATGETLWRTGPVARCDGSPGVAENAVLYGSCDSALHVFDTQAARMARQFVIDEDSQIAAGVALGNGGAYAAARSGKVLRLNIETAETDWLVRPTEAELFATPALAASHVVVSAQDGEVIALDRASGETAWRRMIGGTPLSPVISGDKVLVSSDSVLHVFQLRDGAPLASVDMEATLTSPALAGTFVFLGCGDGRVVALHAPKEKEEDAGGNGSADPAA